MTAASFLSTRMLNVGQTEQQRRMQLLMPLFFVFIFVRYPAALMLYWTTQTVYQYVQQLIMTRDQREKGWRGILGIKSADSKPGPKRKADRGAAQRAQKQEKPQVRPDVRTPEPTPAVAMAGGGKSSFDALAARRDLEEKRQRRRRSKKKRRRR
jgi:membrane protein insertase Oxa1/YidC/SpoIIIJ